ANGFPDPLALLTHLFLDGEYATHAQVVSLLTAAGVELLAAVGLLTRASHNPELWSATVMLYPRGPLMLASDRATRVDGAPANEHDDIVFSALTDNTERFLDLLPCAPCERFLDLGAGTGVAALTAAGGLAGPACVVGGPA